MNNDGKEDKKEIENIVTWWTDSNFSLNINKAKELVIDFRSMVE